MDAHFNFHFANAFDGTDGSVNFDVVRSGNMQLGSPQEGLENPIWNTIDYAAEVPYSTLERYTLLRKEGRWTYTRTSLSKTLVDFTSVAPSVSCQKHRYVYAACGSDTSVSTPPQGLIKIDCDARGASSGEQKWIGERHEWLGESIFAPRQKGSLERDEGAHDKAKITDEDDGYVLSFLFDGRAMKSHFLIFDAKDIKKGPIARVPLPTHLPFGLHGCWVPGLLREESDIARRWKACRSLDTKSWNEVNSDFSGLGLVYDL